MKIAMKMQKKSQIEKVIEASKFQTSKACHAYGNGESQSMEQTVGSQGNENVQVENKGG